VTDTRTREKRRQIMQAVRSENTSAELALRSALFAAGVRGWRCHYRSATGTPDLAWPALRVAVFVDGAFWHGHPSRHRPGRSGTYWDEKIAANVARDRRADRALEADDWKIVRVWDFEIRHDLPDVLARIAATLADRLHGASHFANWQRELCERSQHHRASSAPSDLSRSYVGAT
jgi:DNA mismatch endonuclease (patch repair protein)